MCFHLAKLQICLFMNSDEKKTYCIHLQIKDNAFNLGNFQSTVMEAAIDYASDIDNFLITEMEVRLKPAESSIC